MQYISNQYITNFYYNLLVFEETQQTVKMIILH